MSKAFFVDTSKCTACRGCQVACKEWKGLPATLTKQRGSHQNPEDLGPYNNRVVRFNEEKINGRVVWNFFPDQCRHCIEPPCKDAADSYVSGAVVIDEPTGAVVYTDLTRRLPEAAFEQMLEDCPYHIPRRHEGTGLITKCNMCVDRVSQGLVPICVKTCPTGALNFGDRDNMLALAQKRLGQLKKDFPDAQLVDEGDVNVIYLISYKPDAYHNFVVAQGPTGISRKTAIAKLTAPIKKPFRAIIG